MPTINLTFNNDINVSVQVGDIIYYAQTNNPHQHDEAGTIIALGYVIAISNNIITVNHATSVNPPGEDDFIMFAKDRGVNMSSLLGYFAKFRVKNNSTDKAEMYSISAEITESSK